MPCELCGVVQHTESCHQRSGTEEHLPRPNSMGAQGFHTKWMDGWTRKVSPYRHTNNNYYLPKLTIGMSGDEGRIIIVVPDRLRTRMLEIAPQGHQRQVRTKQLLRAHVWLQVWTIAVKNNCIHLYLLPSKHNKI